MALPATSLRRLLPAAAAALLLAPAATGLLTGGAAAGGGPARIEFGRSAEGRELIARRIGSESGPHTVLVVGEIHGDEEVGRGVVRSLRRARSRARGLTIWTVSTVNPDGHEADARTNSRGVDLNRNFPFEWSGGSAPGDLDYSGPRPLSEPESRGFRDLVRRLHPEITIIYHQPWNAVLGSCSGPAPLQRRYARIAHMDFEPCRGANLPGTMTRWTDRRPGTAFVVEFGPGRLGAGAARRNARAVRALARG